MAGPRVPRPALRLLPALLLLLLHMLPRGQAAADIDGGAGGAGAAPAPAPDASQVLPYFEQYITVVEAENMTRMSEKGGWEPKGWAHSDNYYSATTANTFHSRRAHLRSGADAPAGLTAAASVVIKRADNYQVLARYEAPYRFDVPFELTVHQGGKLLLRKTYGWRSSLKVWGFGGIRFSCGAGLQSECAWP